MMHLQLNSVQHWNEVVVIAGRARSPVLCEVSEHIDVIPDKIEYGLSKGHGDDPCTLAVPR